MHFFVLSRDVEFFITCGLVVYKNVWDSNKYEWSEVHNTDCQRVPPRVPLWCNEQVRYANAVVTVIAARKKYRSSVVL